jgi:hypothetical protein
LAGRGLLGVEVLDDGRRKQPAVEVSVVLLEQLRDA